MSVERFLRPEAAREYGLAEEIRKKHEQYRANGRAKFLVTSISLWLAETAIWGLREIASFSTNNRILGHLSPDSPAFKRLPLEMQDKFLKDHAVFRMAPAMRGIEMSLTERRVYFEDLVAGLEVQTHGTKLPDIVPPQEEFDPIIDDDQHASLIQLRKLDPSHMIYFTKGYDRLHPAIKHYLDQTGALFWIGNLVTHPFRILSLQIDPPLKREKPSQALTTNEPDPQAQVDETIANLAKQFPEFKESPEQEK